MELHDIIAVACALGCFYFGLLWFKDVKDEYDAELEQNV